jgi:holo-[acyl-carrier protein] synthase
MTHPALGLGLDIVSIPRFALLLKSEEFGRRAFTESELASRSGPNETQRLAACYAAKEAVLKALGTGWAGGVGFRDIEVSNDPSGAPTVALHGPALRVAEERGITAWLISLSHTPDYATAVALALGGVPRLDQTVPPSGS